MVESSATQRPPGGEAAIKRPAPGVWAVATAVYAALYVAFERSGVGSAHLRDLVSTLAFLPLNLLVASLNYFASRNPILDPGVRRALRLLAGGATSVLIGNLISCGYYFTLGESPAVSWADPFYLADCGFTLAALLSFPLVRRTRLDGWKFVVDAATVLVGGGIGIWFLAIRPAAGEAGGFIEGVIALAYPMAGLLLLLGITMTLLRRPLDGNRRAFHLLVMGVVLSIGADLTFDLILAETGERVMAWIDAIYLIVYILLVSSAEMFLRQPMPASAARQPGRTPRTPSSILPYIAIGATYGLLLGVTMRPWTDPVSPIAAAAVVITALVVVRQFLTVRENVQLIADAAARRNEARFRALVQHASDVILVVRGDFTIRFASPSVARVLHLDPAGLSGLSVVDVLDPADREAAQAFLRTALRTPGVTPPVEWRFARVKTAPLHVEVIASNLLAEPDVRGLVLNLRDVSERKQLEKQLTHLAFHDPLTGLANRALFRDRVSHALALSRRQGTAITVVFLDLDDFKQVNDTLGHGEGDRLISAVAERLEASARSADTVARFGGDEFAILLEDPPGTAGHPALVERLTKAMARPFPLAGNELYVTASIGVATATSDETADDLLRNADMAMYTAKRRGTRRGETYQSHMYADLRQRMEMELALRAAIEREELHLVYQPMYDLRTRALRGVEALVRWDHPRYGSMLPLQFIPLAEETGLIVDLGGWVLRQACRQLSVWRQQHPTVLLDMAVNVSSRQLHELDIVQDTMQALEESGVDPGAVVLEITESVLMQQTGSAQARLKQLKSLGVRIAIDDFGTGYSSLSYLQRFPIDILKLAKPFVEDVASGDDRAALARAILGLGQALRLMTVAEGVERADQCAALAAMGCDLGQGYHFAPPLHPDDISRLLAKEGQVVGGTA